MDCYSPKHVERILKIKSNHKNFVHFVGYTRMHTAISFNQAGQTNGASIRGHLQIIYIAEHISYQWKWRKLGKNGSRSSPNIQCHSSELSDRRTPKPRRKTKHFFQIKDTASVGLRADCS